MQRALRKLSRQPSGKQTSVWAGIALLSLLQLVYVAHIRQTKGTGAALFDWNWHFHLDPYDFGLILQELLIPLALLSLLSSLPFFRAVVNGTASRRGWWLLFIALLLVQALSFIYLYELNVLEIWPIPVLVVVLVAGFIGGWSMGFAAGVLSFFLLGLRGLLLWPPEDLNFREHFYWYFIVNGDAAPLIYQGLLMGLLAMALGRSRFIPPLAFALGFSVEGLGRYLSTAAQDDPWQWLEHILTPSLMSGLVLAVVALMVRNVQVNHVRQQAEAAALALTQAELRALRAQINPHFLFNSLNTIRYFVRTEPDKARELLLDLSEVFQRALRSGDFVPLKDEISYVEAYLALEQARLGERLHVQWTLPDERILEMPVPTLILQPIVENAVIHGLAPKPEGGTLSIVIEPWDGELVMQVRDDGLGFNSRQPPKKINSAEQERLPIGLSNIRHRLKMLYGSSQRLQIESEPGRGTRVQLKLPLQSIVKPQLEVLPALTHPLEVLENPT